uniref:Uncharacterized protein n=1 Tax=Caenorhabditis japonica TaxID=281687 RepID=A0A8R1ICX2_CAEJA
MEFEPELLEVEYDAQKFERLAKDLKDRRNVSRSLQALFKMKLPHSLTEKCRIVSIIELYLYNDQYWENTMHLIRKLEAKQLAHDSREYAQKLKESRTYQVKWKEARLQKIEDLKWLDRMEERKNAVLFSFYCIYCVFNRVATSKRETSPTFFHAKIQNALKFNVRVKKVGGVSPVDVASRLKTQ